MPGRVTLPGAQELFRSTGAKPAGQDQAASGRVRHSEKITVYVSSEELVALEDARLSLRKAGIGVDRGRIVRAAIVSGLAELEHKGIQADLVARLGAL